MRILILNWRDLKHEWAGGGEVYITELAKRWVRMGHQVTMFCGQDFRRKLPSEEILDGIRIIRKGGKYSLYFWAIVLYLKRLRKETDCIVDVQNGIPFFSPLYSRKPRIVVVYHVHGEQFFIELPFPYSLIGYLSEKYFFPFIYAKTKVIAISETTRSGLAKLGFRRKHIEVVYCGINGSVNSKVRTKKFSHPTILYLGRLKKYKRVDLLVDIMPEIVSKIPEARLMIAGWGTEGGFLTDISMRSGIRKKVKILGPVSEFEKHRLLAKSWVFINPSIQEGWGISVIEANLHGTPAIAFNVPGLSESIRDEKTGLLVQGVNNKEDLVKSVLRVLTDKELRQRLGHEANNWARRFSWDKAARESEKVILEVTRREIS